MSNRSASTGSRIVKLQIGNARRTTRTVGSTTYVTFLGGELHGYYCSLHSIQLIRPEIAPVTLNTSLISSFWFAAHRAGILHLARVWLNTSCTQQLAVADRYGSWSKITQWTQVWASLPNTYRSSRIMDLDK